MALNKKLIFLIGVLLLSFVAGGQNITHPHLREKGASTQLIVDGRPWLMLGGELGNSSAAGASYMKEVWPRLEAMELNTVLAPVYWELIEPVEGEFDFSSVDRLIDRAREHDTKLVLLWFGSWKNSMSCYAPLWVKEDWERFPRSQSEEGVPQEILTPFSRANLEADKKAFTELMEFIREKDQEQHTVIMVQVENEIGMLPDARDYHPQANEAFNQQVPDELISFLKTHEEDLQDHLRSMWVENGKREQGTWEEVFGQGLYTDELFMAWHYAEYTEEIASAGKEVYPLPMYVNAALNSRGRQPGEYPSAGPLAHLIDIWNLQAPSLDLLAPDIYDEGFNHWCHMYHLPGNPLFIPEIRNEEGVHAKVFYALGEHDALGFSPFSIERTPNPENAPLTRSYRILHQLKSLIAKNQGTDKMVGFWFQDARRDTSFVMGDYRFHVSHDHTLGWTEAARSEAPWEETGGLIVQTGEDEFIVAGTGVVMTFETLGDDPLKAGIGRIDRIQKGSEGFQSVQRLNGDQSHQGRHLRIPFGNYDIQKIWLYRYQ